MSQMAGELGLTRNAVIGIVSRGQDWGFLIRHMKPKNKKRHPDADKIINLSVRKVRKGEVPATSPSLPPEEPSPSGLTLFELRETHCRWTSDAKTFCGAPKLDGYSWCEYHYNRVFNLEVRPKKPRANSYWARVQQR